MSDQVVWEEVPKLSSPLMVIAFEGLFDAGDCATGAVATLRQQGDAQLVASIDPDEFYDFQEARPTMKAEEDGTSSLVWPGVLAHVVTDLGSRDLVLLSGTEPRMRWRTFCEAVIDVATGTSCELVVTLGAMAANVPHSRPALVKGSAGNRQLADRLRLSPPTYQGPTGIIGTFHDMADRADLPVVSLRVSVPHYVAGPPNPKGTRALLSELEWVTGVPTNSHELDGDVEAWEQRVSEVISEDAEIAAYIARLEQAADREISERLPSADELGQQIEAFLRERTEDDTADAAGDGAGDDAASEES